jgi:class 3 adenylate cyclase
LDFDIRRYISQIRAPVCLMHDVNYPFLNIEAVRWLASRLPSSEVRLTDAGDPLSMVLPSRHMVDDIEEYLTGRRSGVGAGRSFCALMFTDLTGSTEILNGIGDERWAHLLDAHRAAVRSALRRFGGAEVDTAGDGFFATFGLPSEALRCAQAIRIESAEHGLSVRIGLHCGEVVRQGDGVSGLAVHVASRIAGLARPGEVLLSGTVLTSVLGTKLEEEDAGEHELKGVPGRWRLHRLVKVH